MTPLTALGSPLYRALLERSAAKTRRRRIAEGVKLLKGKKVMGDQKPISADSHVNEPADLWVERIETKFRDRAPRIAENLEGRPPSSGSRRNSVTEHLALPRTSRVDRPGRTWFWKVSRLYT